MSAALSLWWVWITLALGLGIAEVLLPGFIFLGFALAAAIVGAAMLALPGFVLGLSVNALLALFGGLSLIAWLALRAAFRHQSSGSKTITHDINDH